MIAGLRAPAHRLSSGCLRLWSALFLPELLLWLHETSAYFCEIIVGSCSRYEYTGQRSVCCFANKAWHTCASPLLKWIALNTNSPSCSSTLVFLHVPDLAVISPNKCWERERSGWVKSSPCCRWTRPVAVWASFTLNRLLIRAGSRKNDVHGSCPTKIAKGSRSHVTTLIWVRRPDSKIRAPVFESVWSTCEQATRRSDQVTKGKHRASRGRGRWDLELFNER